LGQYEDLRRIRVEAANDVVDVELWSRSEALVESCQYKRRNQYDTWGQRQLIDELADWSDIAHLQTAHRQLREPSYRIAGLLLLLYAQPLAKIAALQTTAISQTDGETRIALGKEPIPVPEPFASQLNCHRHSRPNLRTPAEPSAHPGCFRATGRADI
jgi:hypothetical protein